MPRGCEAPSEKIMRDTHLSLSAKCAGSLVAGLLLLLPGAATAQEDKPAAAVAPVSALGDVSEGEKGILVNSLQSSLSKSYSLVSPEDYQKAETRAFEELDLAQCTEAQCIRKIQELLQVDRHQTTGIMWMSPSKS